MKLTEFTVDKYMDANVKKNCIYSDLFKEAINQNDEYLSVCFKKIEAKENISEKTKRAIESYCDTETFTKLLFSPFGNKIPFTLLNFFTNEKTNNKQTKEILKTFSIENIKTLIKKKQGPLYEIGNQIDARIYLLER